jgi:transposase
MPVIARISLRAFYFRKEVARKMPTNKRNATKKMGRPTKLTDEIQTLICNYIQAGNYIETAAAAAGINKKTLYEWLKRGKQAQSGIYKEFSNAVEKALAISEIRELKTIKDHSAQYWQAAAWRLERRFPDRWGRKDKLQADINSHQTNKEEVIFEQKLTADPEARELLKQLFRKQMELEKAGEK